MPRFGLLVLMTAAVALTACATHPVVGQLQTKDNKPLTLASRSESLTFNPGLVSAEFGDNPANSGHIKLKNNSGEFTIATPKEIFSFNHFQIENDKDKLSTNLKGVWRENTLEVSTLVEMESCQTQGYCPETVRVSYISCPSGDYEYGSSKYSQHKKSETCQDKARTEIRNPPSCPGRQPVQNTYQRYTLSLELDFLNPANPGDRLGRFEGVSQSLRRRVDRQIMGPCLRN